MKSQDVIKMVVTISCLAMVVAVGCAVFHVVDELSESDDLQTKYTLYIGLGQITDDTSVEESVMTMLRAEDQEFTFYKAHGGYSLGQTYVDETSLVFVLNDCDDDIVEDIVEFVNEGLGLAIMVEEQSVKSKLFL